MKTKLAFLCLVSGAAIAVGAYFIAHTLLQSFLLGLSTNVIALGIGILIVNRVLENDARKSAVRSLLILSERAISDFHNPWLSICWSKVGREEYGRVTTEYLKSGGKPTALKEQDRKIIYELYKLNPVIHQKVAALDETLVELSRMAGWSLSPELLTYCLQARISISRLRAQALDDSLDAQTSVTEHMFDIDAHSGLARSELQQLAGIKDKGK
jgi:hypothetical protein